MSSAQAAATQVFVPRIFDAPDERGVIVKAYKAEGDFIAADEPLVELRSHDVDGEVVAPFAGTIVRLHAAHGDTVAAGTLLADLRADVPKAERAAPSSTRTRIGAQAPRFAALLCASPALLVPLLWSLAALIAWLALAVARDLIARSDNGLPAAPLTLLPRLLAQCARWAGRSVARITPVLAGLAGLLAGLVLAVLVPALAGGGLWLASHGGDGLAAAARIAVADHAFAVFAFLACLWPARRFWRDA
ncbi:MAG TPA: lipoyl domain-containing protein, partial [Solirubrobacter sp.]